MKTKIIPFDIDLAKKIQAGKIEGKILDIDNYEGTIITTEGLNTPLPVVIKFNLRNGDNILFFGHDGKNAKGNKLFLEVPDNEQQFKPFDKVLVKMNNDDECSVLFTAWTPAIFQCYVGGNDYYPYLASGILWGDCIPYEGNEHLVGTTNEPKED